MQTRSQAGLKVGLLFFWVCHITITSGHRWRAIKTIDPGAFECQLLCSYLIKSFLHVCSLCRDTHTQIVDKLSKTKLIIYHLKSITSVLGLNMLGC